MASSPALIMDHRGRHRRAAPPGRARPATDRDLVDHRHRQRHRRCQSPPCSAPGLGVVLHGPVTHPGRTHPVDAEHQRLWSLVTLRGRARRHRTTAGVMAFHRLPVYGALHGAGRGATSRPRTSPRCPGDAFYHRTRPAGAPPRRRGCAPEAGRRYAKHRTPTPERGARSCSCRPVRRGVPRVDLVDSRSRCHLEYT